MTSNNFDIEANNLREGDLRMGLDENGTREVMDIMRRENVTYVVNTLLKISGSTTSIGSTRRASSAKTASLPPMA